MRAVSAVELLDVWERAELHPPFRRAQALLEVACPDLSAEAVADLPIGDRDRRLLAMREVVFGPRLTAVSACPACDAPLDVVFGTADLATPAPTDGPAHVAEVDDYFVEFRLPNGRDLAQVASVAGGTGSGSPDVALLERCTLVARRGGVPVAPTQLPGQVVTAVAGRMADADPQVDVEISLTCPACAHGWETPFDIVAYLWAEIDAWARRTLREVHALASAYGWRESDILAMTPRRRQRYLELAG